MNILQRAFNSVFPIETDTDPNAGRPGAMGIHFDINSLNICAPSHDRGDDTGEYEENDERFARCLDAAEEDDQLFANAGHKRWCSIVDGWSNPAIRVYRWLRGQY